MMIDVLKPLPSDISLSVVIPTRNEAANIRPLFTELNTNLPPNSKVIIVDDSDDDTHQVIKDNQTKFSFSTTTIVRSPEQRRGGLATAVARGLAESDGAYVVVMDADLQHPPALIPKMLNELKRDNPVDVVIASRYVNGGSRDGLGSPAREAFSMAFCLAARVLFPKIRAIQDPMSGFFLIDRHILDGIQLNPIGFKILLEILVRTPWQTAEEVGYVFAKRQNGESKADVREGIKFFIHLYRLKLQQESRLKSKMVV